MNERLQELSQLAWTKTSEAVPFYDSTGNISRDFNLKYQQEFAELIIRECLTFVEPMPGSGDIDDLALEAAREGIKQHFGVEE